MPENKNTVDKRVLLGGILIVLGGLFLFNTMNVLDFRFTNVVFSWPFIMLVIGLFVLVNTEKKFLGGVLSGIGALFLIPRIFPEIDYDGGIVIPLFLIILGTYIIIRKRKADPGSIFNSDSSRVNKDKIDDVSIFGGGTKIISSSNFQGKSACCRSRMPWLSSSMIAFASIPTTKISSIFLLTGSIWIDITTYLIHQLRVNYLNYQIY
jgi:hypothetical protein